MMNRVMNRVFFSGMAMAVIASAQAWSADLAKVNGRAITDKDVRAALSGMTEGQRDGVLKDPNNRKQVLSSVIDQQILIDEAIKNKLDQGQDYKDALENFRKRFLASRILETNIGPKLNQEAIRKYYDQNKDRYSTDQAHAMHILVSDEKQAREILKMAQAPGADFQALAEKHSKDPSAKNNRGDLGVFGRDRMVPEFTDAVFRAKAGDIVGPVKTDYGYHIIKVVEKKAGKAMSFEDVQVRAQSDLQRELTQQYVGGLRKNAKIEVLEK